MADSINVRINGITLIVALLLLAVALYQITDLVRMYLRRAVLTTLRTEPTNYTQFEDLLACTQPFDFNGVNKGYIVSVENAASPSWAKLTAEGFNHFLQSYLLGYFLRGIPSLKELMYRDSDGYNSAELYKNPGLYFQNLQKLIREKGYKGEQGLLSEWMAMYSVTFPENYALVPIAPNFDVTDPKDGLYLCGKISEFAPQKQQYASRNVFRAQEQNSNTTYKYFTKVQHAGNKEFRFYAPYYPIRSPNLVTFYKVPEPFFLPLRNFEPSLYQSNNVPTKRQSFYRVALSLRKFVHKNRTARPCIGVSNEYRIPKGYGIHRCEVECDEKVSRLLANCSQLKLRNYREQTTLPACNAWTDLKFDGLAIQKWATAWEECVARAKCGTKRYCTEWDIHADLIYDELKDNEMPLTYEGRLGQRIGVWIPPEVEIATEEYRLTFNMTFGMIGGVMAIWLGWSLLGCVHAGITTMTKIQQDERVDSASERPPKNLLTNNE